MQAQTAVVSAPSLTGRRALAVLSGVALVALAAQIAIPVPGTPVPMTLQPLAVLLVGGLLGPRLGAGSLLLYLALGAAGLPVFTPYGLPGVGRLFGPTGGYLLAYPIAAYAVGRLAADGRRWTRLTRAVLAGLALIRANFERQVKKGTVTTEQRDAALARIRTAPTLDAVADAELVVEAATERPDVKFKIFSDLDRLAPPAAILASNTSSISITTIAAQTKRPPQVVGMHFMNPVPVMPLVEVIRGLETHEATIGKVVEVVKALEKTPVVVNDAPGFVSNRVLMPMINEAVFCVMEGVATPVAIDRV